MDRPLSGILAAPYFVLFLFSVNAHQLPGRSLLAPLLLFFAGGVAVYALAALALGRGEKACIFSFAFWLLFFGYGRIVDLVASSGIGGVGSAYLVLALFAVALSFAARSLASSHRDLLGAMRFLNVVISVLVIMAGAGIAGHYYGALTDLSDHRELGVGGVLDLDPGEDPPDIYYLVLDGYPSSDVLEDVYGYDNDYFLEGLEDLGFYVAEDARSNYPLTFLSLASALNFRYLDELRRVPGEDSDDQTIPRRLIERSDLAKSLAAVGYEIVHFNSGWGATERSPLADRNHHFGPAGDQFISAILSETPLAGISEAAARHRILETLDRLPTAAAEGEGPSFVFAHIMPPHPPYLLDADGRPLRGGTLDMAGEVWSDREGYLEQLRFVNRRVLGALETMLEEPGDTDPIVVLASDHGTAYGAETQPGGWGDPSPGLVRERTSILAAYRVPPAVEEHLYPAITPVNFTRILLSEQYEADLEPLEDRVYFTDYESPYRWRDAGELED